MRASRRGDLWPQDASLFPQLRKRDQRATCALVPEWEKKSELYFLTDNICKVLHARCWVLEAALVVDIVEVDEGQSEGDEMPFWDAVTDRAARARAVRERVASLGRVQPHALSLRLC